MSCGITFLSDNLVDSAVVSLTTGTENAQFPLSNVKNEATAVRFRSQENSVVILFDLQQTRTIDTIAIHGNANGTLGLTNASIKTSLTTDFSGSTAQVIPLSAEHLIGYSYITSVDHRYVELTLTGSGIFAELSNIFIGERINIEQNNLSVGSFKYGRSDKSTVSGNKYGQTFVDKRNLLKYLGGALEYCTRTEQQILDDMFIKHSRSSAIWMIVDPDSMGMLDGIHKLTVYGYFEKHPIWAAKGGLHYSCSVRVNQAG